MLSTVRLTSLPVLQRKEARGYRAHTPCTSWMLWPVMTAALAFWKKVSRGPVTAGLFAVWDSRRQRRGYVTREEWLQHTGTVRAAEELEPLITKISTD